MTSHHTTRSWEPGGAFCPFVHRHRHSTHSSSALCAGEPPDPCPTTSTAPPALALLGGSRMEPQLELPSRVPGASRGEQRLRSRFAASCTHGRNTFSSSNPLTLQEGQDDKSDYINVPSFTQLFGIYKFTVCFNGRTTCLFLGNYCFSSNGFSPSMRAVPCTPSSQLLYIHGQQSSWQNPQLCAQCLSGST